ncbi:MAG TPA: hypothetical protein VER32_03220 [Pyrinomonadaceae bacterium]|nr:hypothetical protein [Pyrinomonadaceae bacterium]
MRKLLSLLFPLAAFAVAAAAEQSNPPQPKEASAASAAVRTVKGRVLTSSGVPPAQIKFDDDFKYIGSQDFILYDVARAEQHFFVDAGPDGRIRRLYWVQFEGYLPSNTHTYDYKSTQTVRVGPFDFYADSHPVPLKAASGRPDSDGARARAFLESKGLRVAGDDILLQRLVHLVDEKRRDELLIIYIEDLSAAGLTAADLAPGGRAAERWPRMSQELLRRALGGIKISR